jgi:hypothetical protein
MLHLIFTMITNKLLKESLQKPIPVSEIERIGRCHPQQHANKLTSERLHHLALEFCNVDLSKLIYMRVYLFRQSLLVVL